MVQLLREALGTVKWVLGDTIKPENDDYWQHTAAELTDEEMLSGKWNKEELQLRLPPPRRRQRAPDEDQSN